jgi:DNA-binding response OmpR family regulator
MSKTAKVVLVEDDNILSKVLKTKLKKENIQVIHARDGEEGKAMVIKEKPNLVLLDLILPKMHGYKVLESLKDNESTKDIPIIVLSNLGQESDKIKAQKLGAKDYWVKASTSISDIAERVKNLL